MKKKSSPTKILESRKDFENETALARVPGKEFENVVYSAKERSVQPDYQKIRQLGSNHYSSLHTHPISHKTISETRYEKNGVVYGPNLPSEADLRDFLLYPKEKTMIIAQQDPENGKVEGYYFIRKTRKTPYFPEDAVGPHVSELGQNPSDEQVQRFRERKRVYKRSQEVKNLDHDLYNLVHAPLVFEGSLNYTGEFVLKKDERGKPIEKKVVHGKIAAETLEKFYQKYGLRFRAVSVRGYYYDKGIGFRKGRNGSLELKKESLEHRVTSIIALGSFVASVLLLSAKITGNVVAGLSVKTASFLGAGLFVIGLIAGFFWLKSRKNDSAKELKTLIL